MSAHLYVSLRYGVKVTRKEYKALGFDLSGAETLYGYVAGGGAPDPRKGPDFYVWAKDSYRFIASTDGDERNADAGVSSVSRLKGCSADEERYRSALTGLFRVFGLTPKDPEWLIVREVQ